MSKLDWVPVRSQAELRPGVLLRSRCIPCKGWALLVLVQREPPRLALPTYRIKYVMPCACPTDDTDGWSFDLDPGDVFRLADTASDTTADNETRARETAGGRER